MKEEFIKVILNMGFKTRKEYPNLFVKEYQHYEPHFRGDPSNSNTSVYLVIYLQNGVFYIGYDSWDDRTISHTHTGDLLDSMLGTEYLNQVKTKIGIERFYNKYIKKVFQNVKPRFN